MQFSVLNTTCCSITIELTNHAIYQVEESFDVKLDGEVVLTTNRNVFTLFNLEQDRDYVVTIGEDSLTVHTTRVSYILHTKDFKRGSGEQDDTLALQMAINMTPENGLLVFDEGEYHIRSLFLKSDITIQLKKGAVLLGSTDIDAYPLGPGEIKPLREEDKPLELLSWEGDPFVGKPSILAGYEVKNVNIVGEGVVDGQAQKSRFWEDVKHLTWGRPRLLFLMRCENINVVGITLQNTPCWTVHPYFSKHLGFYDLFISNPKDSPNTDGMDPEACDDLKIIGVRFSVGDDCIALKSGKIYIGSTFKKPCNDVTIRNCFMNEGHGAIVLGSEAGAGLTNLLIERCYFKHTDRGLRIKSRRGRGKDSVIDNVTFRDIYMDNVLTPLTINMFYFCDPDGKSDYVQDRKPLPIDDRTPYLGKFTFERMTVVNAEYALGYFAGLPEQLIGEITISDSTFTVKEDAGEGRPIMACNVDNTSKMGFNFLNVKKVNLHNVKASGFVGQEEIYDNVQEVNHD